MMMMMILLWDSGECNSVNGFCSIVICFTLLLLTLHVFAFYRVLSLQMFAIFICHTLCRFKHQSIWYDLFHELILRGIRCCCRVIFISVHCHPIHTHKNTHAHKQVQWYMRFALWIYNLYHHVNVKPNIIDIINEYGKISFNAKAQNSFNVVQLCSFFLSLFLANICFVFLYACTQFFHVFMCVCACGFGLFVLQNGNYVSHFKIFECWKLLQ